jgi:hypothetical protein
LAPVVVVVQLSVLDLELLRVTAQARRLDDVPHDPPKREVGKEERDKQNP